MSQWNSIKLSYLVVSSQFQSYDTVSGGNYVWAGSSDLIVDVSGTVGTFGPGSLFAGTNLVNINTNGICGYLGYLPNNNAPVFDYVCDGAASNDRIIPHYYIMGIKFTPGTYELAASALIPNYYTTSTPYAQFGITVASGFGPLVSLNTFGGAIKRIKIGIVLTILKNLATNYPNSLQIFSYSEIYTTETLYNQKDALAQGFLASSANKYKFEISSIAYRIFGFSSFALTKLPTTSTAINIDVEIPDLYTLYVDTDNTDYLSDVNIASDMYTLNQNTLCGGSTQPALEMQNIGQLIYNTVPDLLVNQQNIQQTSS